MPFLRRQLRWMSAPNFWIFAFAIALAITITASLAFAAGNPSVTSILPSGNLTTTDADVSVYYTDNSGSGIATGAVYMSLNGSDITGACIVTADYASCPRTGLGQGANSIDVSVADNNGGVTTDAGSFFIDTKVPSAKKLAPTNVTGGGYGSDSAALTGYVVDVASLWPVAANSGVDQTTIAVTFDGAPVAGCSVTPTTYMSDSPLEYQTTQPDRVPVPGFWLSCPAVTGMSQGSHTFVVTENDMFGNAGSTSRALNVDTIAPTVTNLSPSGVITTADTVLGADLSDGSGTGVKASTGVVTLDGSAASGCTVSATSASCAAYSLADGEHSFTVDVNDNTSNAGTATGTFNVDTGGPVISSIVPSGNLTTTDADVSVYYSDAGSGIDAASVAVYLNSENITSACIVTADHTSCPRTGLPQGANAIDVSLADNSGHTASGSGSFFIDNKAPSAKKLAPTNVTGGGYGSDSAALTGYVVDVASLWPVAANSGVDQATIAVTFDGAPVTGCSVTPTIYMSDSPLEYQTTQPDRVPVPGYWLSCPPVTGLTQGTHTFVVTENDAFGNSGSTSRSLNIDTSAPGITGLAPTGTISTADTTLEASFSDGTVGSGIKVSTAAVTLDGAAVSGCTITTAGASCAVSGLSEGDHDFTVSVNDNTGNVSSASGSFAVEYSIPVDAKSYWFTWYDNNGSWGMKGDWILISNFGTEPANIRIVVDGSIVHRFDGGSGAGHGPLIPAGGHVEWSAAQTITGGPVRVVSMNAQDLSVSQRVIFKESFSEINAVSQDDLTTDYTFSWYDNNSSWGMNGDWVIATNLGDLPTDISIYVGDVMSGATPVHTYAGVAPGQSVEWQSATTLTTGPVRVVSSGQLLLVSQRTIFNDSLNEVLGDPRPVI